MAILLNLVKKKHRCGCSGIGAACLETLSLELEGSREDILFYEIYIMIDLYNYYDN